MKFRFSQNNNITEILSPISDSIGLRAGRNFFWMLVSEGLAKITIIIMNLYIARVLTPSSFGIYAMAQSVALQLAALTLFGTGNYGQRQISRDPKASRSLYSELMGLRLFTGLFVFGIFSLFIFFFPMSVVRKEIFYAALILPFGLALKPDWVFRGFERIHYLVYGNIALSLVFSIGTLLLVKGPEDILYALFMRGGAVIVASIVLTAVLTRIIPLSFKTSVKRSLSHMKECVYFGVGIVIQAFMNELIIVISGLFLIDSTLGQYAAPHRISVTLTWIAMMFGFGFYPVLSSKFVQGSMEYKRTFLLMVKGALLLSGPVLLVGMNFSHQIIRILLGPYYAESGSLMLILFPCFLIDCLAVTFSFGLMAAEHQKLQALALIVGFIIMFVVGFAMIPRLEGTGAALAYLIGKLIYLFILVCFFFLKIGLIVPERSFFLYYLTAVGIGLIPTFLPGHWLFRVFLSLILFSSTVFITKIFSLSQFKGLIRNIIQ